MSMPKIPDMNPQITINDQDALNIIISSIGFEELSLSHLLNAEAEKIQYALGTLETAENALDYSQIIETNKAAGKMLKDVIKNQMLLGMKFEDVVKLATKNNPALASRNLGSISHYNGIIFGDMEAQQADTEGALAVRGDISLGSEGQSYDIGAAGSGISVEVNNFIGRFKNEKRYPTLLLGGSPTLRGNRCGIYNGDVVMKKSKYNEYAKGSFAFEGASVYAVRDSYIENYFTKAYNIITDTCNVFMWGNSSSITAQALLNFSSVNLNDFANTAIKTDKNILIVNITGSDIVTLGEIKLPPALEAYETVIFNLAATTVHFSGGAILYGDVIVDTSMPVRLQAQNGSPLKDLATKIIWNMPNATEVNVNAYGVIGSVLAANAKVTGTGGSINGSLVARSFTQTSGMELHAFTMSQNEEIWKWTL